MVIKKKMKKKKPKQSKELKLSFKKITNFTSQSINKVYKNFKKKTKDWRKKWIKIKRRASQEGTKKDRIKNKRTIKKRQWDKNKRTRD